MHTRAKTLFNQCTALRPCILPTPSRMCLQIPVFLYVEHTNTQCILSDIVFIKPDGLTPLAAAVVYLCPSGDIVPVISSLCMKTKKTCKPKSTQTDMNTQRPVLAGCRGLFLKWLANHQELHGLVELDQSIVHHPWFSPSWWFGCSRGLSG